ETDAQSRRCGADVYAVGGSNEVLTADCHLGKPAVQVGQERRRCQQGTVKRMHHAHSSSSPSTIASIQSPTFIPSGTISEAVGAAWASTLPSQKAQAR